MGNIVDNIYYYNGYGYIGVISDLGLGNYHVYDTSTGTFTRMHSANQFGGWQYVGKRAPLLTFHDCIADIKKQKDALYGKIELVAHSREHVHEIKEYIGLVQRFKYCDGCNGKWDFNT